MPEGEIELTASKGGAEVDGKGVAAPVADAPAPAGTVRAEDVDPATLGQQGTGGKPTPEGLALLENKNIVFDDVGVSDIKAGKIDPRIIAVLTKLSQEHKITVSCMCSDHPTLTAGGSVSNHSFGRGLDIAAIDGEIVSPSSPLAREIASELSSFDPEIRPDEIGSPFAINGPGYFTDAAHMNHVHVGFKTELSPTSTSPTTSPPAAPSRPRPRAPSRPHPSCPVTPARVSHRPRAGLRRKLARRGGAPDRADAARRPRDRWRQHGPAGRRVPRGGGGVARQPVVRLVHDLGAREGGVQAAGQRLGGRGDWVRNAEQGNNGLQIVSAEDARPGDIVAYDFGGQSDFGADGHIGFLDSTVANGRFTALEGNNADAVNVVPRSVDDANVVFIRVEGDAPAGAAAPPAAVAPAAAAPAAPAAAPVPKGESGVFAAVEKPAAEQRRLAGLAAAARARATGSRSRRPACSRCPMRHRRRRRPRRWRPRRTRRAAPPDRTTVSGRRRAARSSIAGWMAAEAEKRGLPPQLPVMAGARRVQPDQRELRRRRLARLLPDARVLLEPGRVRGLPRRSGEADRLVPRPGRGRQGAARRPRPVRSTTRTSSANGSPTSNAPPSSSAAATSSASTRPTALLKDAADAPRRRRRARAGGAGGGCACAGGDGARGGCRSGHAGPGGHGRQAHARGAGAVGEQEHRLRRRRRVRHQGRQDRPADHRGADQAQPGAQDHGLVHVLGPSDEHRRDNSAGRRAIKCAGKAACVGRDTITGWPNIGE